MMMGVSLRYSSNREEAEDILHDSFIKVFSKIKSYNGKGKLGGWIRMITLNTALENYRKSNKNNELIDITNLSISDDTIEQLELEDLLVKINKLPVGFRTVFNLYAVEGYNHREIGELLNISIGTSKSQYSRARLILRQMIEKETKQEQRQLKYAK